ncbi:MAG TPA: hypothetical protein VHY91_16690 [Pirellulales bacterium]|jgi:hypothetical protein|nr:hypothetical protein [Pirellulales bacterium]
MERHSPGTLPIIDVSTLRSHAGEQLVCVVCIDTHGNRSIAEPCVTLTEAAAFVRGYNSVTGITGRRAEIRAIAGTITAGRKIRLPRASRKAGAA